MDVKKILVPIDFSGLNDGALALASSLASDNGAKLLLVHVDEPIAAYGGAGDAYYIEPPDLTPVRRHLEMAIPTRPDVGYEHHLLSGDPAPELVQFAEQQKVDLIVMGTHGRTGFSRLLMGSVAEAVIRHANCPVLTLKQPVPEMVAAS